MLETLARFFRGLNMAMGVTTLSEEATPEKERNFVLAWIGILVFLVAMFGVVLYTFLS